MKVDLSKHYRKRDLVKTAIPSIIMMAVVSLYNMVDGFFVSNFAGTTPFAAVNLMTPPIMIIGAIGLMLGTGGCALVSKTMGEGDRDKANAIFSTILRFEISAGLVLGIIFWILVPCIAESLGASGELLNQSILYARVCIIGLPALLLQMSFESFYMTAEKPALGTVLAIITGLMNIGLDALFICVLNMGVIGAAAGTAISMLFGGLYPLFYFSSRRNDSSLRFVKAGAEVKAVVQACVNGMSEYVGNISLSIVSICYNVQLLKFLGENGVSVYGILMYLGFTFASIFIGYNITVTPLAGYNFGAGNKNELRSLLKKSSIISAACGLAIAVLIISLATPLAKLFVGYDPQLMELTQKAIRIYFVSYIFCGFNMFVSAWFTGLNNGLVSAIAAFARTLVFELGSVLLIPLLFGIGGIWWAVNIAELLAFLLAVILLISFRKRYGY